MKEISIIVPVYNAEDSIERCINSIIHQNYKNFELILINDGSKDDSLKILNKYKSMYKNIKVINKKNEGVSKTRNLGINEASGDYIMFIDNDDYIDSDYLDRFASELDDLYDVVLGGYKRTTLEKILYTQTLKNTEWSKYIVMAPWAKLYRKSFLKKNRIFFKDYGIGEDVFFNLGIYSKSPKIKIIDYSGYNWFYNDKSVSNTLQKGLNKNIEITKLINEIVSSSKYIDDYFEYFIYRYFIWYLLYSGRNANKVDFIKEYSKIKNWEIEKGIKLKINPLSSRLNGESLKNRMIVLVFTMIDKFGLIKLFASIYCRGDKIEE